LRLESAAVNTTMFITLPIYGAQLEKKVTNGLCPA
jgi:hypothetical protein